MIFKQLNYIDIFPFQKCFKLCFTWYENPFTLGLHHLKIHHFATTIFRKIFFITLYTCLSLCRSIPKCFIYFILFLSPPPAISTSEVVRITPAFTHHPFLIGDVCSCTKVHRQKHLRNRSQYVTNLAVEISISKLSAYEQKMDTW